MIGRFRYQNEIFYGTLKKDRVVVEKGLYSDTYNLNELHILAPTNPTKIICVGLNYTDHAQELDIALPDHPILFLKPPSAVIGCYDRIIYPPQSKQVDYEGELAVVIGKRCKNVTTSRATDVIMGYTCFNDVTARDIQNIDHQWTRAKSFDTFAPLGPYIIEADNLDLSDSYIRTRVNGELKQDSNTNKMVFGIPALIEYISSVMTLEKGDIIGTGTPAGIGELQVGDIVEVEIKDIGILKNKVAKMNA